MISESIISSFFNYLVQIAYQEENRLANSAKFFKKQYLNYLAALRDHKSVDSLTLKMLKNSLTVLHKPENFFEEFSSEILRDIVAGGKEHQQLFTEDLEEASEIIERLKAIEAGLPAPKHNLPVVIHTGRTIADRKLLQLAPTKQLLKQLSSNSSYGDVQKLLAASTNSLENTLLKALKISTQKATIKKFPLFERLFDTPEPREYKTPKTSTSKSESLFPRLKNFSKIVEFTSFTSTSNSQQSERYNREHRRTLLMKQYMNETLAAFADRLEMPKITQEFILQNWKPESPQDQWGVHTKEAFIYLVTGNPLPHSILDGTAQKLQPLQAQLLCHPLEALENMGFLGFDALTVLCRLFNQGMRGNHLRDWMRVSNIQKVSHNHSLAILALVEHEKASVDEALERTKGISENDAWIIYSSIFTKEDRRESTIGIKF